MPCNVLHITCRAVARSENPGGHIVLGGDNVPPLVEIGLSDLSKSGGSALASTDCLLRSFSDLKRRTELH